MTYEDCCRLLASNRSLACRILVRFSRAQLPRARTGCRSEFDAWGIVGNTVRVTRPSRSNPRNVSVNMRCEMLAIERRSSLGKRAKQLRN